MRNDTLGTPLSLKYPHPVLYINIFIALGLISDLKKYEKEEIS
jgi:hypothetical protein